MSKARNIAFATGAVVLVAFQLILPTLLDLVTTCMLIGGAFVAGRMSK